MFYFTPWTPSVSSQKKQSGTERLKFLAADITDQGDYSWRCVRMSISISFFQRSSKREKEDRNVHQAKQTKKENLWTSENGYHKVIRWPSSKLLGRTLVVRITHIRIETLKGHFTTTLLLENQRKPQLKKS